MYREQLGPDGKTLLYRLPAEGGATPGTPAALDGTPIMEPYAGLEVSGNSLHAFRYEMHSGMRFRLAVSALLAQSHVGSKWGQSSLLSTHLLLPLP